MSMPTIPLNTSLLVVIVIASTVPGIGFPPRTDQPSTRSVRLAAGLILGCLAGWLLGNSVLASELPIPTTVLALLAATVLFAEGLAGRGWPVAGCLSATVYLAAVALDLLDRTGERMSWTLWPIAVAIGLAAASSSQFAWRVLWNVLSRRMRARSPAESEIDKPR